MAPHEPAGERPQRERADRDQERDVVSAFLPYQDAEHHAAHADDGQAGADPIDLPLARVRDVLEQADLRQHDRDDHGLQQEADAPRQEGGDEAAEQRPDGGGDRGCRSDQRIGLLLCRALEVAVDQRLHRGQQQRGAEAADDRPEDDDRRQILGEGHRHRPDRVAQQTQHVRPFAAEEVADLAADQDERRGDQGPSAIALWTELTVVSRSRTTAAIDTFINDVSTTSTNMAAASTSDSRALPAALGGSSMAPPRSRGASNRGRASGHAPSAPSIAVRPLQHQQRPLPCIRAAGRVRTSWCDAPPADGRASEAQEPAVRVGVAFPADTQPAGSCAARRTSAPPPNARGRVRSRAQCGAIRGHQIDAAEPTAVASVSRMAPAPPRRPPNRRLGPAARCRCAPQRRSTARPASAPPSRTRCRRRP